ncbi:MAG: hypothetical protein IJV69_02775 [Kiritimatiellae bacterium]|nr:hypothetical protein [Kiritimatiellia bacterium]
MIAALQEGVRHFLRNPLQEALAAAFFLIAAITGLFLGVGALIYFVHLMPKSGLDPVTLQMQMLQRFRGTRRVNTAFWLGIIIWLIAVLPNTQNLFLGLPIAWLLIQPFWFALLITDHYDLSLPVALKATYTFTLDNPLLALQFVALGLLAFSGLLCFGIGIFVTLPIALVATLHLLASVQRELSLAIQRAY